MYYENGRGNEMELVAMEDFDALRIVEVKIGDFSARAIGMYEMPHQQVLQALTVPHGPAQMVSMLEIFKLALLDQKKVSELDILSFNDMAEILGQWTMKSTMDPVEKELGGIDPEKIIAMLADPDRSLNDVMEELNKQLEGHEDSEEPQKKKPRFGFRKNRPE